MRVREVRGPRRLSVDHVAGSDPHESGERSVPNTKRSPHRPGPSSDRSLLFSRRLARFPRECDAGERSNPADRRWRAVHKI